MTYFVFISHKPYTKRGRGIERFSCYTHVLWLARWPVKFMQSSMNTSYFLKSKFAQQILFKNKFWLGKLWQVHGYSPNFATTNVSLYMILRGLSI